ncbi:MAG: glycosyltransferase, partial [Geminicoccaceae bacterium]
DGRTGFLVPHTDIEALVAVLQRLVDDPELRATMSRHNRAVAQRFSVAATADEYETLFSRIGRTEPAPACAAA